MAGTATDRAFGSRSMLPRIEKSEVSLGIARIDGRENMLPQSERSGPGGSNFLQLFQPGV